jgi:Cdc6-like AAA superfamily ATPase
MTRQQILPTILIVIDLASAVVYLSGGDARKVIYWLSAAALTAAVTY